MTWKDMYTVMGITADGTPIGHAGVLDPLKQRSHGDTDMDIAPAAYTRRMLEDMECAMRAPDTVTIHDLFGPRVEPMREGVDVPTYATLDRPDSVKRPSPKLKRKEELTSIPAPEEKEEPVCDKKFWEELYATGQTH